MLVSSSYLAEVLNITDRRVRQLVAEDVFTRDGNSKKYYLPDCVQKYFEYKYASDSRDADYEKERALHERAKRKKAELILAQMKAQLFAADDIERVMTNINATVRARLRGVPVKIAPLLLAQNDVYVVQSVIAEAIDECLTELSDYDPKLFVNKDLFKTDYENDEGGDDEADKKA